MPVPHGSAVSVPPVSASLVEERLKQLLSALTPDPLPRRGRGRPAILPTALLWTALAVGVVRGFASQRALWRLLSLQGLWDYPRVPISDKALYKRLASEGPGMIAELFAAVTRVLVANAPDPVQRLAPFATTVVALDESTLDQVARTVPALRAVPNGAPALLPGKVAAVFDLNQQLFRDVQFIPHPHQNEKVAARRLLTTVPPGSLIVADLGYFGFRWFDELTEQGYFWISRDRARSSGVPVHTLYARAEVTDTLVWLGKYRADQAKHLVRKITIRQGGTVHEYLTNVRDPAQLAVAEVVAVYGERWSIEQAFKAVKRDLGLHLLWSARPAVVEVQVWAVFLIAQVIAAIRSELAAQVGVPIAEVSVPLLLETLPALAARHDDPLAILCTDGKRFHIIRPTRRVPRTVPPIDPAAYTLPPPDLVTARKPRYAGKIGR